ncbi:hypothetical protein ACYX34_14500 [Nitrospira sp. CMX1]|nr:hypothetical protein [Nitrospira sp.]
MLRRWFDSCIICLVATGRRPAAIVLVILLQAGVPPLSDGAPGGKTEVLPMEKAAPAAVVIEASGTEPELRRQMRTKNGVAELESGTVRFSLAPTGRYGFIAPKQLGMALVTQSPDLMLERVSSSSGSYEIHKLGDGSGLLVGFVGNEVVPQIKPSERPKSVRLFLYSNSFRNATTIAAVPLTKLMVDQMPRRIDSRQVDGPVLLEMDLQGTANRKAPSQ